MTFKRPDVWRSPPRYPPPEPPPLTPEKPIAVLVEVVNDQREAIKQLQEIAEKHAKEIMDLQRRVDRISPF